MSAALEAAVAKHRGGDIAGARQVATAALRSAPRDATLLHFLGMIEAKAGRLEAACDLFERAVAAQPGYAPALVSFARLLAEERDWPSLAALTASAPPGALGDEFLGLRARAKGALGDNNGAADDCVELSRRRPDDYAVLLATARAFVACDRFADAERAYCQLLGRDPANPEALLGLTGLLETINRPTDLAPFFAAARRANANPALVALGEAIAAREEGNFDDALALLDAAHGVLPEGSWFQMRGDLNDRAGDADRAFESFTLMNAADRADTPEAPEGATRYRAELLDELSSLDSRVTPQPLSEERAPPLFLLGFPRSGTTLLDTFLMGHPDVQVHEERPFLEAAARLGGPPGERRSLDEKQYGAMRAAYWRALDSESRPGLLQIDKNPLATAHAGLIDALFPGAPIVFMLRHPCDVILSCFITRFRLNWGVAAFLSLEETVAAYDLTMRIWTTAREQCALKVEDVRYEELIDDPERALRRIAQFAGIEFEPTMLDHAHTARERGHIATPSHAQVARPLYRSSAGRWRRYRSHLAPYLPQIAPWCDRFGYSIAD